MSQTPKLPPSSGSQEYTCPNCGAHQVRRLPDAVTYVCEGCGAQIDLSEQRVMSEGAFSDEASASMTLGERYMLSGLGSATLVGAVALQNDNGDMWQELFFVGANGHRAWLAVDQRELYLFRELSDQEMKLSSLPITPEEITEATRAQYAHKTYTRDEQQRAQVVGLVGEFSEEYELNEEYSYWQGYDEDEEDSLSAEWDAEGNLRWSHGLWVEPESLHQHGAYQSDGTNSLSRLISNINKPGCITRIVIQIAVIMMVVHLANNDDYYPTGVFDIPTAEVLGEEGRISLKTPSFTLKSSLAARIELVFPEELKRVMAEVRVEPVDPLGEAAPIVIRSVDASMSPERFTQEPSNHYGAHTRDMIDTRITYEAEFGVPTEGKYVLIIEGVSEAYHAQPTLAPPKDPIGVFIDVGGVGDPIPMIIYLLLLMVLCIPFITGAFYHLLFGRYPMSEGQWIAGKPLVMIVVGLMVSFMLVKNLAAYMTREMPVVERGQAVEQAHHANHFFQGALIYSSSRWVTRRAQRRSLRSRSSRTGRSHSGFGGGK